MSRTAVIDCASLIYLSHLHKSKSFFHYLHSLFSTIYFPQEVVREYATGASKEPHRQWILNRLLPEQGFYRFCTSFDSIVLAIIETEKRIDKGEAETYAQLKKVNAHFIISDDKPFTDSLKKLDGTIRVYSVLHLLSWLECQKLLPDWYGLLKSVYQVRRFSAAELRGAFVQVSGHLGLAIPKKVISEKCGLSKILQTGNI